MDPEIFHNLVITAICKSICCAVYEESIKSDLKSALAFVIDKYGKVFQFFITGRDIEINTIDNMASFASSDANFLKFLPNLLYQLYNLDLISEEAVISWYDEVDDEDYPKVKERLENFVNFLKE